MRSNPVCKLILLSLAGLALLIVPVSYLLFGSSPSRTDPVQVLSSYLRAAYARDFKQAYGFISSQDRRLKGEKIYVRERGPFSGFTLEVTKKLAEWIEAAPLEQEFNGNHARIKLKLRLPDANGLSEHLFQWDEERLNALAPSERRALIEKLEQWNRAGKIPVIEGEETFNLVKEGKGWSVFLDWASGVRIAFDALVPEGAGLEVSPVPKEVVIQSGELFNVAYRVKNRSKQEVSARIRHHLRPKELAQHLDLVECALFLLVRMSPGEEQEYSSTYLVRGDLPEGQRHLFVTYEFEVASR